MQQHFAFGGITYDYQIDMSAVQGQFQQFRSLTGTKRIVSFGGWAFSTQPSTFSIFRTAVTADNRAQFASNVAQACLPYCRGFSGHG
jgi:chitinase